MIKAKEKKYSSMTDFFQEEFVKEAQAENPIDPNMVGGQAMPAQPAQPPVPVQDPNQAMQPGILPPNGMPPVQTNSLKQSAMPSTTILCNSDCRYSQNEKGVCSLNKIEFSQVKVGIFECANYEPVQSEQTIMPQQVVEGQ